MAEKEIKIQFPEEKMEALSYFMEQKDLEIEKMLTEYLEKTYEKMVPAPVRKFMESKLSVESEEISREDVERSRPRRAESRNQERSGRRNSRTETQNVEAQAEAVAEEGQGEEQEETNDMVMGM